MLIMMMVLKVVIYAVESTTSIKSLLNRAIAEVAAENRNSKTFSRQTALTLERVLSLLIGIEGGSLAKELHRAGIDVTPAALSQRRAQIAPSVFQNVFDRFNALCEDNEKFHGYRLLAIDGSSINKPRNPNEPSFICNASAPNGYNQMHLNALYDLGKTFYDVVIQPEPQKDEIGALVDMIKRNNFSEKTIIIADRGYESYNLIAHLIAKDNIDFVIRVKQNRSAMREIARLPMCELDCNIGFTITTTQTNEDKAKRHIFLQVPKKSKDGAKTRRGRWDFPSPYSMRFRIVRFQLETGVFETIATSLPSSFTVEDIKELYHKRWSVESSFRDLKYTMGLVNLHGRSDDYARQEIFAALTIFNFTSRIAREVVIQQPRNGVYAYRVNFKMAAALCREYFRTPGADGDELARQIARHTVPIRPGRQDQRNLKAKGFVGFTYRMAA